MLSSTTTIGTLLWAVLEILDDPPKWSEKADIYSLGMVFFEIFSGGQQPYYPDQHLKSILHKIESGIRPKIPDSCPVACIFFFLLNKILIMVVGIFKKYHMCWDKDPKKRPTS
jgi:serine/threonine protein kinase